MAEITITVNPSSPGCFDARIRTATGDRVLLQGSRTPFCNAARVLLRDALAQPEDTLVMRHAGSDHDALRASVSVAAGLAIDEEGGGGPPRFRKWKPHPRG